MAEDDTMPASEGASKAKAAAQRALELDDALAEAHSAQATIAAQEFQWSDSENEFKRAIELKPNYAVAHWQYGWVLVWLGRPDEALKEMKRAAELDPLSPVMTMDLTVPYTLQKHYERAIAQCHKAMDLDPSFFLPHFGLAWVYILQKNYAAAIEECRTAQAMETNPIIIGYLGFAYGKNGQQDKAMQMLTDLDQLAEKRFVTPFCQALVYLGMGDNGKAIDWFEKAYAERSIWMGWLKVQPMLDPLRSDPRFQALYNKLNFPP
jgi:Tfp pilus assembly protein PilF